MKYGACFMVRGWEIEQAKTLLMEHIKEDLAHRLSSEIVFEYYAVTENGQKKRIKESEVTFFATAHQQVVVEMRCNAQIYFTPHEFEEDAQRFMRGGVI